MIPVLSGAARNSWEHRSNPKGTLLEARSFCTLFAVTFVLGLMWATEIFTAFSLEHHLVLSQAPSRNLNMSQNVL